MTTPLSEHFTLEEFTRSHTADELGIDNTPSPEIVENLKRTAATLETVRKLLAGLPIVVTSGYRCERLNSAIPGSSHHSAHMDGLAVDFTCAQFGTPQAICRFLQSTDLAFDQLIFEYGEWVHLGLAEDGHTPRREVLTIDHNGVRVGVGAGL